MVISLVFTTIYGFINNGIISFYGESARAVYGICGHPYSKDENYLGASWKCPENSLDIITPKIVKAGYKIQIKNGTRLNHD